MSHHAKPKSLGLGMWNSKPSLLRLLNSLVYTSPLIRQYTLLRQAAKPLQEPNTSAMPPSDSPSSAAYCTLSLEPGWNGTLLTSCGHWLPVFFNN